MPTLTKGNAMSPAIGNFARAYSSESTCAYSSLGFSHENFLINMAYGIPQEISRELAQKSLDNWL